MRRYAVYETQGMLAALQDDGYALVSNTIPPQLCEEAREKVDALTPIHWDEVHGADGVSGGGRFMDRYLCVFNRDPFWLQFLDRPGLIELAEAALGADCHVIGLTAWRSHHGSRGEPLHVDYLPPSGPDEASSRGRRPIFILTAHFYLSDVTPDVAPTRVVPGSHRAGRVPREGETHWKDCEPEPILALAGDSLVFRSDVWHAGSDNRSPRETRYLLQAHYGRREMAQHFSPFIDWRFDPAVLSAASRRQRRLLGDHDPGAYD